MFLTLLASGRLVKRMRTDKGCSDENRAKVDLMVGRRMGPPDASVRFKLLDATERVLARDGYPSVTSRNVGQEAGVDQKLVFYYFRNMEELIVATFHRRSEEFLGRLEQGAAAKAPARAIWDLISDRSGRLMIEFMAMATRNAALKEEVQQYTRKASEIIEQGLSRQLANSTADPKALPASFLNFALGALARGLIVESELGLIASPGSTAALVEGWIARLET